MEIIKKKYANVYIQDYPPEYDVYNNQLVEINVDAAIDMILRILYGRLNTLPNIPDAFLDIERYKHTLATEYELTNIQNNIKEKIEEQLVQFQPSVDITTNPETGRMDIEIIIRDDVHLIRLNGENIQNKSLMKIDIDKKAFYK